MYSLGFTGGIGAFFKGMSRGEVNSITQMVYKARENCLAHIEAEANEIGADAVIGVKVFIYEMGSSFVEVMAIGTAVVHLAASAFCSSNNHPITQSLRSRKHRPTTRQSRSVSSCTSRGWRWRTGSRS